MSETKTSKPNWNIVRTQGRNKAVFLGPFADKTEAIKLLKHWKNMARNSGGRVFFDLAEVPADVVASVTSPVKIAPAIAA